MYDDDDASDGDYDIDDTVYLFKTVLIAIDRGK